MVSYQFKIGSISTNQQILHDTQMNVRTGIIKFYQEIQKKKKAFDKLEHLFVIETPNELNIGGTYFQHNKAYVFKKKNPMAKNIIN